MADTTDIPGVTLTPAQKGAQTRAANKAAREAEQAELDRVAAEDFGWAEFTTDPTEVTTLTASSGETFDVPAASAKVQDVVDIIDAAAASPFVEVTASRVTPKIPAKVRDVLYTIGIILGVIGTGFGPVVAVLTGDAQIVAISVVGLALSLSNLMAKLNLSKTATDIAATP